MRPKCGHTLKRRAKFNNALMLGGVGPIRPASQRTWGGPPHNDVVIAGPLPRPADELITIVGLIFVMARAEGRTALAPPRSPREFLTNAPGAGVAPEAVMRAALLTAARFFARPPHQKARAHRLGSWLGRPGTQAT